MSGEANIGNLTIKSDVCRVLVSNSNSETRQALGEYIYMLFPYRGKDTLLCVHLLFGNVLITCGTMHANLFTGSGRVAPTQS